MFTVKSKVIAFLTAFFLLTATSSFAFIVKNQTGNYIFITQTSGYDCHDKGLCQFTANLDNTEWRKCSSKNKECNKAYKKHDPSTEAAIVNFTASPDSGKAGCFISAPANATITITKVSRDPNKECEYSKS